MQALHAWHILDVNDKIEAIVESVSVILPDGTITQFSREQCKFGYRTSIFQANQFYIY